MNSLSLPHVEIRFRRSALLPIQWGLGFLAQQLKICIARGRPRSGDFYRIYPDGRPKHATYNDELAHRLIALEETFSPDCAGSLTPRFRLDAIDLTLLLFAVRLSGKPCCSWPKTTIYPRVKTRSRSLLPVLERHRRRALRIWKKVSGSTAYPQFRRDWRSFNRWMRAYLISDPSSRVWSNRQRFQKQIVNDLQELANSILRAEGLKVSQQELRKLVRVFLRRVRREREATTIGAVLERRPSATWCLTRFLLWRLKATWEDETLPEEGHETEFRDCSRRSS